MKVMNRSTGQAGYSLPELNKRRVFNVGEIKELTEEEILALYNTDAGRAMLCGILQVQNKDFVKEHIWPDAPIEYFWTMEDIKKCMLEEEVDLFAETIDYAPEGVIDIIKDLAWRGPLNDHNKCMVLKDKLGFDPIKAHEVMTKSLPEAPEKPKQGRLRKEA